MLHNTNKRLVLPMVTLIWYASKYKGHKLHQWYILRVELCTLYLLTCQVTVFVTVFV